MSIEQVVEELQGRIDALPQAAAHRALFIRTYLRTTLAVGQTLRGGGFEDRDWVQEWDVVFADYFLRAHDADRAGRPQEVPRPWQVAFSTAPDAHPLHLLLLGMNAHINYDLPQSLLAMIPAEEFADAALVERRRRDHERIDGVLASRVGAEDVELSSGSSKALLDRVLTPANRWACRRFLRESRQKVWHNTTELHRARLAGADAYQVRLGELEILSAAKVADLLRPGQVLLRLAVAGFGVTLPPARELGWSGPRREQTAIG